MAKKGGAPENLKPVRTKEEARERGRNGGIRSGEVRRAKKTARENMKMLIELQAKGKVRDSLKTMGIEENEDLTILSAMNLKLVLMAMDGNIQAYDRIMKMTGDDPDEMRKEAEEKRKDAAEKRREEELNIKKKQAEYYSQGSDIDDGEETEDVQIYMPYTDRDEGMDIKREKM